MRQYLEATLQPRPKQLIASEPNTCVAFRKLVKSSGKTNIQKCVDLLDKLVNHQFTSLVNPLKFVSKFEDYIIEFRELGDPLLEKLIKAYFLHKKRSVIYGVFFYHCDSTKKNEKFRLY